MENFSVSEAYSVGNELLDAQHKVILSYMAKVYRFLLTGEKGKDLFELVERLDTFCKLHLLDEENEMEEMDFPVIEDHKFEHAMFIRHLDNFVGGYEELDQVKSVEELLFLKEWFMEHIQVFDKRYADYKKRQSEKSGR
jgi:hemerythrin